VASVGEPRRLDLAEGLSSSWSGARRPTPRCCSMLQRADEADDGSSIREDAHHIGAPADLLVQALLEGWYFRSGARAPLRKCRKASRSQRACSRCQAALRQLPSQRLNHSLELSLHLGGVRLVEDGAHQGCHPGLLGLGHLGEQIPQIVGTTPLPGGPWQRLPDRLDEATVRISRSRVPPR